MVGTSFYKPGQTNLSSFCHRVTILLNQASVADRMQMGFNQIWDKVCYKHNRARRLLAIIYTIQLRFIGNERQQGAPTLEWCPLWSVSALCPYYDAQQLKDSEGISNPWLAWTC